MSDTVRIVIADDNPDVLMATADLLQESAEVEVLSLGTNVSEIVEAARSHQPHIAFVDAWLVGGGAESAGIQIRAVSPGTMVVALASASDFELVDRLRAAGVAGCYEKETLSSALPRILASVHSR